MKKILVLLGILALSPIASLASLNENETSSMEVLGAQGFSRSTLEAVDWANYRNGKSNHKYVRYFQPKQHKFGRLYQRMKVYTDPIQDDGTFGDRQIEFSNTWMGDKTFYSSDKNANKQIENL